MREPHDLSVRRCPCDVSGYRGRGAREGDFDTLITEPTIVRDEDEQRVIAVYLAPIEEDCTELVTTLRRIRIHTSTRTSGMKSRQRDFGFRGRRGGRFDNYCSSAEFCTDDTEAHALVCSFASVVARYYAEYGPEIYAWHQRKALKVLPQWMIEGGPFTSGVVNRDNALPYHKDSGNFRGVWSNMLGFKCGVQGGYLAVPEYNIGFEIADRSLLMFDGQTLVHGVTPFQVAPDGYRFTVVYYSWDRMWKCLPFDEELKRARLLEEHRR